MLSDENKAYGTKWARYYIIFSFLLYYNHDMEDQVMLIAFHQRLRGKMRF